MPRGRASCRLMAWTAPRIEREKEAWRHRRQSTALIKPCRFTTSFPLCLSSLTFHPHLASLWSPSSADTLAKSKAAEAVRSPVPRHRHRSRLARLLVLSPPPFSNPWPDGLPLLRFCPLIVCVRPCLVQREYRFGSPSWLYAAIGTAEVA